MTVQRILSWQINSINQERQEVLRSIDGAPATVIATLSATDTSYVDNEDFAMTTGVAYQVASIATINGVEVKQVSTPVEEIVPAPTFTPFTAVIGGEYFALRTMKGATIVKLDGVVLAPYEPSEDEPEDEVYDWYSSMTTVPGSIVTVSPKDSVSPLASIKIGGGISEVTEWCSLGHVASPGDTMSPVIFGHDIVSVPDYLPAEITNLTEMFSGATLFNDPNIVNWDVSKVTTMRYMFFNTTSFNQPLNDWDVSNVINFNYMFAGAVYNQPLDNWVTTSATDMSGMFNSAEFNQPLNDWDVSNVTDMNDMFAGAVYNQPLNGWNLVSATNLHGMFRSARVFNQPINLWNVSNVTDMANMFNDTGMFNQNLTEWCVANITSKPDSFDSYAAALQPANHPVWGTCPRGENAQP